MNAAGAREELCFSPLPIQTKVYRRRWLMLVIFLLVSMSSAFQWIQFAIINNLIMKYGGEQMLKGLLGIPKIITYNFLFSRYYNVDSTTVDWTSLVYMVTYVRCISISIKIY